MAKSRREKAEEFRKELYLQASFFGMKSLGSASLDDVVNKEVTIGGIDLPPMPHPRVETKFVPQRETWHKTKPAPFVKAKTLGESDV